LGWIRENTSKTYVNWDFARMTTLYGLPNCDTSRAAKKALEAAGKTVTFHDVRSDPLDRDTLARFYATLGEGLVNRRSTTWRGLSEDERAGDPVDLLVAHPTLMKRPVIAADATLTLGWDAAARATHLG
jgi:arsenate reductase-like glutaredoxin family protein